MQMQSFAPRTAPNGRILGCFVPEEWFPVPLQIQNISIRSVELLFLYLYFELTCFRIQLDTDQRQLIAYQISIVCCTHIGG